jgi:ribonuclease P protein component
VQRIRTKAQFQAVMTGGATVSRTEHFALHRAGLQPAPGPAGRQPVTAPPDLHPGPGRKPAPALFAAVDQAWIGVILPKRWARRAVTRNAIKRQIYTVSQDFEAQLPAAAHVVRLRAGFDKAAFRSATSPALKLAVRTELQQLFTGARK